MKNIFKFIVACILLGGMVSCQDWSSDLNSLDDRLTALELTTTESFAQANERITILEEDVIPALESALDNTNASVQNLWDLKADKTSVDALSTKLDEGIKSLTDADKTLAADLVNVKTVLDEQKAALDALDAAYKAGDEKTLADAKDYTDEIGLKISEELAKVSEHVSALDTRVTKIESDLVSMGKDIKALSESLALVSKDVESLQEAVAKINKTLAALANQIQSIAFVPQYENAEDGIYVPVESFSYVGVNDTIFTSAPKFEAVFAVRPARLVSSLSKENVHVFAHSIETRSAVEEFEIPVEVVTYPENGQIQVNATVTKDSDFYKDFVETGKFVFVVAVDQENAQEDLDCGSYLTSNYVSAHKVAASKYNTFEYTFFDGKEYAIEGTNAVEVPWDQWRTSERVLFDQHQFRFVLDGKYYTPEEVAEILGAKAEDIVPSPEVTFDYNKNDFVVNGDGWNTTAKINLENIITENAAKTLVDGKGVTATLRFYMTKDDTKSYLDAKYVSTYKIVNVTADPIKVSDIVLNWNYTVADYVSAKTVFGLTSTNIDKSIVWGYVYDSEGNRLETSDFDHFCFFTKYGDGLAAHVNGVPYDSVSQVYTFKGMSSEDYVNYPVEALIIVPGVPAKEQNITLANTVITPESSSVSLILPTFNGQENKYINSTDIYKCWALYGTLASGSLVTTITNEDNFTYASPITNVTVVKNGEDAQDAIKELVISFHQDIKDEGFFDASYIKFNNPVDGDVYDVTFSITSYWGITYNYTGKFTYSDPVEE